MDYKKGDLFRVTYFDSFSKELYKFQDGELIAFTGIMDYYGKEAVYEMENSAGVIEWMMEDDFMPCEDTLENTYETIKNKIKEYKEEEEIEMNYEKGDLFKLVSEIPSNKLLKKGQIVELVSKGSDLFTIKDAGGKWHYVPFKFLEYYDELANAPLDKSTDNEMAHIMDFHKDNYINKCLDEGDFEALEKL